MKILGLCLLLVGCVDSQSTLHQKLCADKIDSIKYAEIYKIDHGFYGKKDFYFYVEQRKSWYSFIGTLYTNPTPNSSNGVLNYENSIEIDGRNLFQECVGE